jgi:Sulfotransferase domain
MSDLATPLLCRRPELVARPFGENGSYLVRDRLKGESFQLGPEEHFLLAWLDGTRTAADLCAAFGERFGKSLTPDELQEFLDLARERGFLQPDGSGAQVPLRGNVFPDDSGQADPIPRGGPGSHQWSAWIKRLAVRLLSAAAAVLQSLANRLSAAAGKLQWVRLAHLEFVPRPDDIFIVTYPRSGTTWMQMILYQLTTDGSMDIPHIYEYCPWFERSSRSGLGFEARPSPRLFKSHLPYRKIPKGPCKYVYVARDGKDVAVSYYHLYCNYNGFEGTFPEFFDRFLRGKVEFGSWFQHVRGWWVHRHDPNVLFLRYEDLLDDLEGGIGKIIAFCGFEIAPERLPTILERCRFAFMKQHESQFDPVTGAAWEQGAQGRAFLRTGRAGDGKDQLSPEQAARFDRAFEKFLGPTGLDFSPDGSEARSRSSSGNVNRGRGSEPSPARRPALVFHPPEVDG